MLSESPTAALFSEWARNGRAEGMEQGHFPRALHALQQLDLGGVQQALDVGCGNGWASRWLADRLAPGGRVLGVDASASMVERAAGLGPAPAGVGLRFEQAFFESLPLPDRSVDLLFSMEALYYAIDLPTALAELARVVRPGGQLLVVIDHYEENPHCHGWRAMMGIPMLLQTIPAWVRQLEAAGFTAVRSFRCLDPRPVDPALPAAERAAAEDFRQRVGSLALHARRSAR